MNALALVGRRAGNDRLDARRLGRRNRHVGRSNVRITAGRHITASDIAWHEFLPCRQARSDLDREFLDTVALGHRELVTCDAAHSMSRLICVG